MENGMLDFFDDVDLYAVSDHFFPGPEAVGQKLPNERGLYDMSGNVKEVLGWILRVF